MGAHVQIKIEEAQREVLGLPGLVELEVIGSNQLCSLSEILKQLGRTPLVHAEEPAEEVKAQLEGAFLLSEVVENIVVFVAGFLKSLQGRGMVVNHNHKLVGCGQLTEVLCVFAVAVHQYHNRP